MALALEAGSEQYAPLARAIIGGLMFSFVVTVFLVPAAYYLMHRARKNHNPHRRCKLETQDPPACDFSCVEQPFAGGADSISGPPNQRACTNGSVAASGSVTAGAV